MDEILAKKHRLKSFLVIIGLSLAVFILIRVFVLPAYEAGLSLSGVKFSALILENLIISLIVTVFIGTFVYWITPREVKRSNIIVLEPKEINPLLKNEVTNTKSWIYKGTCGRYTRSTTIPKLADAARNQGIGRHITIFVLDPNDESICEQYAIYRSSLKSGKLIEWNQQRVQEEILATAVTVLLNQFFEPQLTIQLFFLSSFSSFRFDICDQCVVVTKEDKEASALKADVGTYFYDSYKDDVRLAERQAKKIECCGKLKFSKPVTKEQLVAAINCAKLIDEDKVHKLSLESILGYINKPADPY